MKESDVRNILQKGLSGFEIGDSAKNPEEIFGVIEDTELYEQIGRAFVEQLKNIPREELNEAIKNLKMTTDDDGEIVK